MVIYGKRVVEFVVQRHHKSIRKIYLAKEIDKKQFNLFAKLNVPILRLDFKKAQALAKGGNHQGYLLEMDVVEPIELSAIKQMDFVLVLCGISDVGNLGALFRSAYVLGVDGIVLCGIRDFKQEGAVRTSAGAMLDMPFCVVQNALDVANELRFSGFYLCGTSLKGNTEIVRKKRKIALFLGNEGDGLGVKLLNKMDENLTILQKRAFDSLNVGVAGAILIDRIMYGRA